MTKDDVERWFDLFTFRELHRTVRRLIHRGFPAQDKKDLFQELAGHLIQKLAAYDPHRGHRYVFITVVLDRYAAKMVRCLRTAKRRQPRVQSLDATTALSNGKPGPLAPVIGQDDLDRRRGRAPRSPEEIAQLRSDVKAVASTLPEDLQELADRLKGKTTSEISRETEIPRSTLRDAAHQIQRRFVRSDLDKYL